MEMVQTRSSVKRPLPGDRQGTSGADAGRDSQRTIGGRSLTRRAPTGAPEEPTADHEYQGDQHQPTNAIAGENVAEAAMPQPTLPANRLRQRVHWTEEENAFVARCYFRLTRLETIKTPYSKELYRLVIEKFPNHRHQTVQNILDQRRSIFINNRLRAEILRQIKSEVAVELGMNSAEEDVATEETPTEQIAPNRTKLEFEKNFMLYDGLSPLEKPRLPKVIFKPPTKAVINEINQILDSKITPETTIEELHSLIYTGALTTLNLNNQGVTVINKRKNYTRIPPWQHRLNTKINEIRRYIGILTQCQSPNHSRKVARAAKTIINREKTDENPTVVEILDYLKQKLAAMAKRLKRYKESDARRRQNNQFVRSERAFYKNLESTSNSSSPETKFPSVEATKDFWKSIWSNPEHHKRGKWLCDEKKLTANLRTMLEWEITPEQVLKAVNKTLNWKAPGQDKIQNFWYKQFTATHKHLAKCYTYLLTYPEQMPEFMTYGVTYLLPKTAEPSENPAKYRPITCLPTVYKILTSILTEKIYSHLDNNKLLDEEQKGCRKGSRGCKEQLIIDSVIMSNAKARKCSLHTAYIDYQKAFDSVPHSWLSEILDLYKVEGHIAKFLTQAMSQWKTRLMISTSRDNIDAGTVAIKRGIFQGDALSPLWFCLALRPLTTMLNNQKKGYNLPQALKPISHLWYMDDLKLYAESKKHLHDLLTCVARFSTDIQMKFGLDKCKMSGMENGKWARHDNFEVNVHQGTIVGMEEGEQYKYLGYLQAQGFDHKTAKKEATDTYLKRVRSILRSKLSGKNMAKAISTYATSAITYSFGTVRWTKTELNDLNTKTRKEFYKHKAHHPRSAVERFHLPRKLGGRGIPDLFTRHNQQIMNLRQYFYAKETTSEIHQAVILADRKATPLRLADRGYNPSAEPLTLDEQLQQWKSKPLHGRYPTLLESEYIDKTASTAYLRHSNLFVETEGFVAAIQDQVIATRVYRRNVFGEHQDPVKCRMCNLKDEYLDHIISGCSVLAPKAYLDRHNRIGKIIHQNLREKYMGLQEHVPYYQYEPPPVCENAHVRIYWNRKIVTDKTIPNNIPDIVLTLKDEKKTFIVDFAVPLPTNIEKTYSEKINKYLPLSDEIRQMWNMESVVIAPIVVGSTGEIPKTIKKSLDILGLSWEIYLPLQKSVLLDTCSIVRRVLGEN